MDISHLVTAPTSEPVTLTETKSHLRVDHSDDDDLITAMIVAARQVAEYINRRVFLTQTWEYRFESWPYGDQLDLPKGPLQSVTSITYTDKDGNENTFAADYWMADIYSQPGRVILAYNESWPTETLQPGNAIVVRYVAGWVSASAVPRYIRQAILLIAGDMYENREDVVLEQGLTAIKIPRAADSLLTLDRGSYF